MNDPQIVLTTIDSRDGADSIAARLVESELAACVQIVGPVTSVYRWKGAVETAGEFLLIIKTRAALYPELERTLKNLHPYETPEIIAVPVTAGLPAYLSWLADSTTPPQSAP